MPKIDEIDELNWICPKCQHKNQDKIDDELGPFWTLVCSDCGVTYDLYDIDGPVLLEPKGDTDNGTQPPG